MNKLLKAISLTIIVVISCSLGIGLFIWMIYNHGFILLGIILSIVVYHIGKSIYEDLD